MRELGSRAEDRAADFLRKRGLKILHRNYRLRQAEIDIIAQDGPAIVFVEVKARRGSSFGSPSEAVDSRKQKKIREAALHYLATHKASEDAPARFDVIAIGPEGIEHIMDAFEAD
ncbi:MAG: YraN family protein [Nitrospiraceae bacterium]|nr:YraN family protein [Nitrospiraceae bacterium]